MHGFDLEMGGFVTGVPGGLQAGDSLYAEGMRTILAGILLWLAADFPVMEPKDVAASLAKGAGPAIFQVGPNVLYRGSRAEGLQLLRDAVAKLPHDREIVIYCGCCPWDHCPNIKPAMELLKGMGFTHVKAMYVANNFKADWIDRGYPVE
jgi:thiosulfate/3-mercaptopyruvate sulfurtransferase